MLLKWRGLRRLRRGYCPLCNSSPPRPGCPICGGYRDYGPRLDDDLREAWRVRWNRWIREAAEGGLGGIDGSGWSPGDPMALYDPDLHVETYDWGRIVFDFYDGWMDDIRSCAHGLRERLAKEDRPCPAADRLLGALRGIHEVVSADSANRRGELGEEGVRSDGG